MSNQSQQYFSCLLRAWREREGSHWRFSLEGVNDKEQIYFASFRNLIVYLAALFQSPHRFIQPQPIELDEIFDYTDTVLPEK